MSKLEIRFAVFTQILYIGLWQGRRNIQSPVTIHNTGVCSLLLHCQYNILQENSNLRFIPIIALK